MSGEVSSLAGGSQSVVGCDYGTKDNKSDSNKALRFNGDPEEFSWWKCKGDLEVQGGTGLLPGHGRNQYNCFVSFSSLYLFSLFSA